MTIEQQNQTIAQTLYGALRQRKQRHELLQLGNHQYVAIEAIPKDGVASRHQLNAMRTILQRKNDAETMLHIINVIQLNCALACVTDDMVTDLEYDVEIEMAHVLYTHMKDGSEPYRIFSFEPSHALMVEVVPDDALSSYMILDMVRDVLTDNVTDQEKVNAIHALSY